MSNNGELTRDSVSHAYAQALLEMAQEQGKVEEVADEVDQLAELLRAEPHLKRLLSSLALSTAERTGAIKRLFEGNVSGVLYRFLQVVNHKERMGSLPRILQTFADLLAEERGVVEVDLYVAQRLDGAQVAEVTQQVGQALGREVVLHQYVDPALIGGLKLRIGDRLIDASVAAQLRQMQRQLTEAGREKARQMTAVEE